MECNRLEKYLKENGYRHTMLPGELQQHLAGCNDCKNYYQFVSALELQKGSLEKAPADILPNVEKRIFESVRNGNNKPFPFLMPLFKPAMAGFFALLAAVASYMFLVDKSVGYVENLAARFKSGQFEKFKPGDVLYAGDNTTASIRLKSDIRLQIHQNTIVKINGSRNLSLSRGELSLQAGDEELRIATPGGLLVAKNTAAKIRSVSRLDNGIVSTETTCMVFEGQLVIRSSPNESLLPKGQKAVVTENGDIAGRQQLTAAETASGKNITVQHKLFAAVELLCDCITAANYAPGKKADHLRLFGKEVDENKFKVRVFWQQRGLRGPVAGPSGENSKQYSLHGAKTRRIRA